MVIRFVRVALEHAVGAQAFGLPKGKGHPAAETITNAHIGLLETRLLVSRVRLQETSA